MYVQKALVVGAVSAVAALIMSASQQIRRAIEGAIVVVFLRPPRCRNLRSDTGEDGEAAELHNGAVPKSF